MNAEPASTLGEGGRRASGASKHALLALAGFFLLIAGGLHFLLRPQVSRLVDDYRSAPVLSVKEARASDDGRPLHLDAVVDGSNAPLHRDLVAYQVEEYSSGTRSGGWSVTSMDTPPLLLRDTDGDTITVSGDYALHGDLRTHADGDLRRYRGLVAGDSVGVFGAIRAGAGTATVSGEVVAIGDAEAFVAEQVEGLEILRWVVLASAGLGLLCAAGHFWRSRRPAAS